MKKNNIEEIDKIVDKVNKIFLPIIEKLYIESLEEDMDPINKAQSYLNLEHVLEMQLYHTLMNDEE